MPDSDLEMEKENLSVLVPHGLNSDGKIRTLEKELEMTREKLIASEQESTKLKGNLSEVILKNADQLKHLLCQDAEQRVELANNASKISFLVNQLEMAKEKLQRSEEANTKLNFDLSKIVSECTQLSDQLEASCSDVRVLEAQLDSGKKHALELEDMYKSKLLDQESEIKRINSEYDGAKEHFLLEKEQLQSVISSLYVQLALQEEMQETLEMRNKALVDDIIQCKGQKEHFKSESHSKDKFIHEANKEYAGFKLKIDVLMTEKDENIAALQTLKAVLSSRDDQIQQLEDNVKQLHSKCLDLSAGSESAEKLINELQQRVVHLEKEVGMQNAVISDRAEEKREAIRQLCFSLEHYRNEYQQLREAYIEKKKKEANHFCLIRFP
ncbi:PREDICTED: protein NETWORKED 4A-like [Ipomoea nil]|uniref:protein NETWORKED 4A-like n=1 Tax=Ipomoea nil TaxID=35883 RepID=UPI0009010C77|nr:PREDICTED: protein NETWORKED 4A-like [Ipomoea nil]XP_019191559.1 PREDICTED: protein NETWORKED 4A-like [Ipomoea nil]XP_019191560.1 PREDICTED: protein NETWORKED 4A-like [Ipomoea nil]XP_019191561.1 PREDICTED: protein NETWORKED 4A-like [Ipomoea nil]